MESMRSLREREDYTQIRSFYDGQSGVPCGL
jgi:hypothetical protein